MSNTITRHCINVINELFSIDESIKFLDALCKVEEKAVKHEYENFDSFAADIVPLLQQQTTIRQQSQHPDTRIPEEYCDKAIYNYYQFDSNSTLYALDIPLCPLNQPLLQSLNKKEFIALPRIYIKKNRHLLKEVQENVNGVLALFSGMSKKPLDADEDGNNPRLFVLTGTVTIVHPLGDYYQMNPGSELDGWIKVKIVRSSRIKSVLPDHFLNSFIFSSHNGEATGTLKKIIMPLQQKGTDLATARDNEIIRRFISKVTASCTDIIQLYPTPIQYLDSLIPLSDSLSTPNSENERHSKSSIEASWRKLEQFCAEKFAKVVDIGYYSSLINQPFHERGHFKRVFFINNEKTLQLFYKCTTSQKVTELASYLALKNTECIGNMTEMIVENKQAVGLTMDKYDMTLHHYIKSQKKNLSGERKYELIQQMWKSIVTIHRRGIAHRDLSAHNFMIKTLNRPHEFEMVEKKEEVKLFLIDFGKAVFFRPRDAQHWWVDSSECDVYKDELRPIHSEELSIWCKSLPYMMSKPDHGHRLFRSIQTLPKNSNDHMTLPYLIDPVAEDVYSLGVMTWNLFSGKLPWPGVFDSDLKQIRETVISPAEIDRLIRKEVPGTLSKYLLSCCLRPNPLERHTAEQILEWLDRPSNRRNLISEWDLYYNSSTGRQRR